MILRWYQQEALAAIYRHLETRADNPCVVLPTASGKTPVIAQFIKSVLDKFPVARFVVVAHVKELLAQAAEKINILAPELANKIGIYSASLGEKIGDRPITIAGIQSIFRKADAVGKFHFLIVDECHLIPSDGDGMYRSFITDAKIINPNLRVIGLTATPFRLDSGLICGPENILNHICYTANLKQLILQGYLCPIKTKSAHVVTDLSGVSVRGGEYVADEMASAFDSVVRSAVAETVALTQDRKSVLVFAAGIEHGEHVCAELARHGHKPEFVTGDTSAGERDKTIARFRAGEIKYLVNCNVLTTGFDAPNVDAIALLRATLSPGLYYQMVGRGLRICDTKADCLVLDFGNNALTHGPIDLIAEGWEEKARGGSGAPPMRVCPSCDEVCLAGLCACPACGFEFPRKDRHDETADVTPIVSEAPEWRTVYSTTYYEHEKRDDPDAPHTLRVEYQVGGAFDRTKKEWVCFGHDGFARKKAERWWSDRTNLPCPPNAGIALSLAREKLLGEPTEIQVERDGKYERVSACRVEKKIWPDEDCKALAEAYTKNDEAKKQAEEKKELAFFGVKPEPYYDDTTPF